jgi:RNA polymerase sigma-70 factor (ECF subfamily)
MSGSRPDLVRVFETVHAGSGVPAEALAGALQSLLATASAAWSEIAIDEAAFVRHVAERLALDRDMLEQLATVDGGGLYIACACLARDVRAIASFVRTFGPVVDGALAKMGLQAAEREDVVARLQELLFFGGGRDAQPIIATYTGRGAMRGFVCSVAVKQALTTRHRDRRLVPIDDDLFDLPADQTSPELAYLRDFYLDVFRTALARASRALSKRERNLLRQHYLDGMSLESVARVRRVHRATAARWLALARENLLCRTRQELTGAIDLSPSELESVLSFVKRQSAFGDDMARIRDALEAK